MITKSELIEYLKHTPENTNYNILYSNLYNGSNKDAVDEFIEVLSRGNLSLAALQPYLAKLYEDDKTISPEPLPPFSSGGSVPKPLTYDYMPEGYPKKEHGETVIVENQTISGFQENTNLGVYLSSNSVVQEAIANKYPENSPTIKILWDGTEYECQYINAAAPVKSAYGNTSLLGVGEDTGEPFLILMGEPLVISKTTGDSHEIKVSAVTENITPMAEEFLPATALITYDLSTNTYSSDFTNDELYARLLDGKQIVLYKTDGNEYLYLTKWTKLSSGRIDLAFAGQDYSVSLKTDGTIVKKPLE